VVSGRGLCDELITRPEESYRLCCVVVCDLETSRMGAPIYDISSLKVNNLINILVANRKGKSPFGRNRCRWENDDKMYLRELGYEGDDCIYLAQDLAIVDTVMNARIP